MKAAVYYGARDVRITDMPEPGDPREGEVLLSVRRVALCGTDASEWDNGPRLFRPPVIMGHEFCGVVAALGPGVAGISLGQRVVSGAGVWCGRCEWCQRGRTNLCATYLTHGLQLDGGLAEFVRLPAFTLVPVPDPVSDDAAALAQPQAVAIHAVRRSAVGPDETCVVIGAGGIGAFIIAAVAGRGVRKLIAVDIDVERLAIATRLGADEVIDASGTDLANSIRDATEGLGADVTIEASGAPHAPDAALMAAKRGGRVTLVGLQNGRRELDIFDTTVREVDVIGTVAHVCSDDLPESMTILAGSNIADVVIDRLIGLGDLVSHGLVPINERTAKGKIIVDPTTP